MSLNPERLEAAARAFVEAKGNDPGLWSTAQEHIRQAYRDGAEQIVTAYLGDSLVVVKDSNGEWPAHVKSLLNSWAHRWPAQPAAFILDIIADHQELGVNK